jgi:uncharacterized protein YndB with AHSA1/START domain
MKQLTYQTTISASAEKVWNMMLGPETYKVWAGVSWPGSYYVGEWGLNKEIRFLGSDDGSGTKARIAAYQPNELVVLEHIAMLLPGSVEDLDSDMAQKWVGSIEQYAFTENAGVTELVVTMTIYPDWEEMFNNDWPKAIAKLKEICEA